MFFNTVSSGIHEIIGREFAAVGKISERVLSAGGNLRPETEAAANGGAPDLRSLFECDREVFSFLSSGKELPFFRQNFAEISRRLVDLGEAVEEIAELVSSKGAGETTSPLAGTLAQIDSLSRSLGESWRVWNEDLQRGEEILSSLSSDLFELEIKVRREHGSRRNEEQELRCKVSETVHRLLAVEESLRKLYLIQKI